MEWVTLFVMVPITLCLPIALWIKMLLSLFGLTYAIWVGSNQGDWQRIRYSLAATPSRTMVFRFVLFVLLSTGCMYFFFNEDLFKVVLTKPGLYVFIVLVYALLSVLPQEWLYRVFYTERYSSLFTNALIATLVNAAVFSLAHLFLFNYLVSALTFLGGWLFYRTYDQQRSYFLVCLEHAAYGLWLFTIGMGYLLSFPY